MVTEIIYHRYYDRYLKLFDFCSSSRQKNTSIEAKDLLKEFNKEYKSGFIIMVNCCLLIETLASYFEGNNKTVYGGGDNAFRSVFRKAKEYDNKLYIFEEKKLYSNIRNGLLHQGETYNQFKIRRTGELYNEPEFAINATLFCDNLKKFLTSYKDELINSDWHSPIWKNCIKKIGCIIKNSKNNR